MRLSIQCSLFVLLFFSTLHSSAADFGSQGTLSDGQETVLLEEARYREHLLQSLGCCVCAGFERLFGTDHFKHVEQRLDELDTLQDLVFQNDWQDSVREHVERMGKFESVRGRVFRIDCLAAAKKITRKVEKEGREAVVEVEDDTEHCVQCCERPRILVAMPCGHLIYCLKCLKDNREKFSEAVKGCAICRATVEEYVALNDVIPLCITCEKNPATMIGTDCLDLVSCGECARKNVAKKCPLCKNVNRDFITVFR